MKFKITKNVFGKVANYKSVELLEGAPITIRAIGGKVSGNGYAVLHPTLSSKMFERKEFANLSMAKAFAATLINN
jgi:hypothetical protein